MNLEYIWAKKRKESPSFTIHHTWVDGRLVTIANVVDFDDDRFDIALGLEELANMLASFFHSKVKFFRILYIQHTITCPNALGAPTFLAGNSDRNLNLLNTLLGKELLGSVTLITTEWADQDSKSVSKFVPINESVPWHELVGNGCETYKSDNTRADALRILRSATKSMNQHSELLLQRFMSLGKRSLVIEAVEKQRVEVENYSTQILPSEQPSFPATAKEEELTRRSENFLDLGHSTVQTSGQSHANIFLEQQNDELPSRKTLSRLTAYLLMQTPFTCIGSSIAYSSMLLEEELKRAGSSPTTTASSLGVAQIHL